MRPFEYLMDRLQGKAPKGAKRSKSWKEARLKHLKENPKCAVCESKSKIEVHHIVPFHLAPELELNPENFISLCENKKYGVNCHLLIGHLGNYKRTNLNVQGDAAEWNIKIKGK